MMRTQAKYAVIVLAVWVLAVEAVAATSRTATMPNGATITTTVDANLRLVTYSWDFSALAGDYIQVDITQPSLPSRALCSMDCVVGNVLTGYTVFDAAGGAGETRLQLQYEGGLPPPRANAVVLTYGADYRFTGTFIDGMPAAGNAEGNVLVTFRDPPGGEEAGLWAFTPELVPVGAGNAAPVSDAGPAQTVRVGQRVTLDGSASHDADGDALSFAWSLIGRPVGSAATLSDPTAMQPSFVVDRHGTYEARLIVNDGHASSAPARVLVSTINSEPVADAGAAQTVGVGQQAMLDGSASHDADGDALSFAWSLIGKPAGSAAVLSDAMAVQPRFVADRSGTYVAQLIVNDGRANSVPARVLISTSNSAPVADAGPAQTVRVGQQVMLDGGASHDADGDALSFAWSLIGKPVGSAATLSDPTAVQPGFVVDRPGTYLAQLIVNDGRAGSAPAQVLISTSNSAPVADAGPAQTVHVGRQVTLDGSASHDADGDALSFAWSLIGKPPGSATALSNATAMRPGFVADRSGIYLAQLIVNDGHANSAPARVLVDAGNSAPVANLKGPYAGAVGQPIQFDGSASSDPDGDAMDRYAWSFGDGTVGAGIAPTHSYAAAGHYTVTLTVTDVYGASHSQSTTVAITATAGGCAYPPPATVVIGGCKTGVANAIVANGCAISDRIADIAAHSASHGRFVQDIGRLSRELKSRRLISTKDRLRLLQCAARSDIGKPAVTKRKDDKNNKNGQDDKDRRGDE